MLVCFSGFKSVLFFWLESIRVLGTNRQLNMATRRESLTILIQQYLLKKYCYFTQIMDMAETYALKRDKLKSQLSKMTLLERGLIQDLYTDGMKVVWFICKFDPNRTTFYFAILLMWLLVAECIWSQLHGRGTAAHVSMGNGKFIPIAMCCQRS